MAYEIAVYYDEIGLKGKNRPFFEQVLRRNIAGALSPVDRVKVRSIFGRIILQADSDAKWPQVRELLACVFGIAHFGRITRCAPDIERIIESALAAAPQGDNRSFAVRATRVDKQFPLRSIDVCRAVGTAVSSARSWKVDLSNPQEVCSITILQKEALVSWEKLPGPGGLPIGVSGTVACLLSGGIDSPVAAWRLMRRGALPVFVHFHSYPFTERSSQETAKRLVRLLLKGQPPRPLYLVPLGEIQQRIIAECPSDLRVLLYRRFMFRIAERIALKEGASALVTGEALGQVASQTLENLGAIEVVVSLPVLRPLVGFDKKEITACARSLGTYELRGGGRDDCCSYLVPAHPATKASAEELGQAEAPLEVEKLVQDAFNRSERLLLEGIRPDEAA